MRDPIAQRTNVLLQVFVSGQLAGELLRREPCLRSSTSCGSLPATPFSLSGCSGGVWAPRFGAENVWRFDVPRPSSG